MNKLYICTGINIDKFEMFGEIRDNERIHAGGKLAAIVRVM